MGNVVDVVSEKLTMGNVARLRLRLGSVNTGTMRGRYGEVVEMMVRRRLDFCCLQETRWKGEGARMIGDCKFFWIGCDEGTSGVGILVAKSWIEHVIEVKRINQRMMVLRIRIGKSVLNLVSVYAPQVGRAMNEKEEFFIQLGAVLSAIKEDECLIVCGDMNGHVGKEVDGFDKVHGGHGFGSRNLEGEMLLEFADAMDLAVANTWFMKEEGKLVTYESGGCRSVVDYCLIRKNERKMVRNVNVIQGEACFPQHKLLLCVLDMCGEVNKKRREPFTSRCKVWKLKELEIRSDFQQRIHDKAIEREDGDVDFIWCSLRECLLEVADEVCGKTKGNQRHSQTWWWNDDVAQVISEKQRLYKLYDKSKKEGDKTKMEENRKLYQVAKCEAKRAVYKAQEEERKKFGEMLDEEDGKGNIFRVAKQIVRSNKDVVGSGCVKDGNGKIVVDDQKILEVWKAHYDKISNEEFMWNKESIGGVGAVNGPCEKLSYDEVNKAIQKMKGHKASGPTGVVADMIKASGVSGTEWVTDVCNAVVRDGKVPEDWNKSWMVNVYKGKGDALECGSYRGIKLLEHVLKILERVIDARVRRIVKVDDMQFGFMAGKGTTDAIFVVRQLQENYLAKKKGLWMAFVDLEKAFDRVPRAVVWWALRKLGVDEWIVSVIKSMYEDATTAVKVNGRVSESFLVRVGVHQGSVLSPLLFIIVLEALSREFRGGLPMELLYADDLVLLADSMKELIEKVKRWRAGLEEKGLRVNLCKTKIMKCCDVSHQVEKSGKFPCGICGKGVGSNSIKCTSCMAWIHKKCSAVKGRLQNVADIFKCTKCTSGVTITQTAEIKDVEIGVNEKLECVERFCYLGDMIGAGGGAKEASRARVRCAWAKFRELAPILTSRGASLVVKGKVYKACVQRVLVYGSETWPMKVEDVQRLGRAERMMVRWMCGVTLKNRISNKEVYSRLNVEEVSDVVRRGRLRWFGHLERKSESDWVSACRYFDVDGDKQKGRSRKTWGECVKNDLKHLGLERDWAHDRVRWRGLICGTRPTRACMDNGR
jgi:hypothetical protein